jgi:hypothetical protein
MWALWILAGMISVTGYFAVARDVNAAPATARSADMAWNMGVYRAAVIGYVGAHPGFSGSVPAESLALPPWYRRDPRWKNKVEGGRIAVYADDAVPDDVITELVTLSKNSLFVGIADDSGVLRSPLYGKTQIALPAGIPSGAAVWLATIG